MKNILNKIFRIYHIDDTSHTPSYKLVYTMNQNEYINAINMATTNTERITRRMLRNKFLEFFQETQLPNLNPKLNENEEWFVDISLNKDTDKIICSVKTRKF